MNCIIKNWSNFLYTENVCNEDAPKLFITYDFFVRNEIYFSCAYTEYRYSKPETSVLLHGKIMGG